MTSGTFPHDIEKRTTFPFSPQKKKQTSNNKKKKHSTSPLLSDLKKHEKLDGNTRREKEAPLQKPFYGAFEKFTRKKGTKKKKKPTHEVFGFVVALSCIFSFFIFLIAFLFFFLSAYYWYETTIFRWLYPLFHARKTNKPTNTNHPKKKSDEK